jgi:hypothetical protein
MKSIRSKQCIRNLLKEIDRKDLLSNIIIWAVIKSKTKINEADLTDFYLKIYPLNPYRTLLKGLINIENREDFKFFVLDDEGIQYKDQLSKMLFRGLLELGGYDKPMRMDY